MFCSTSVEQIFRPQRQREQALDEEALQSMFAAAGIAVIDEAGGQTPGQVRCADRKPVEAGSHRRRCGHSTCGDPDWEFDCGTVWLQGGDFDST